MGRDHRDASSAELVRQFETDLVESLVGFFDCRHICPIEIVYDANTSVYRYVIVDAAIYLTWFHGSTSVGRVMPESYKFGADSFIYSALRQDMNRKFEIYDSKTTFRATDNDDVLLAHLSTVLGYEVQAAELDTWRKTQAANVAGFGAYLDRVNAAVLSTKD